MATVVLGCDVNGNDKECQDTVASILEKNGHTVEKLGISPTPFADYSYAKNGKNPKGKIGVYLMAGSLVSVADLHGGDTGFKYAYFGIRGDISPRFNSQEAFNTKIVNKDNDCTSICDKYAGRTYPQLNEMCKDKCQCIFGSSPQELGERISKALGGDTGSDSNTDTDDSADSGNVKECIQKLLKHWDGDVECYIRGKNVFINRVRDPETNYTSALLEGVNIFSDGITVTDVNPNTPNHLIVEWTGGTIEFKDEKLIFRFGEKIKTMTAVKKVVTLVKDKSSDSDSGSDSDGGSDGSSSSSDSSSNDSSDGGSSSSSNGEEEDKNTAVIDGYNFNVRD